MSLDELIMDEPQKISKRELDEAYEAYKTIEGFCYRVQEISLYNLDEKANRYERFTKSAKNTLEAPSKSNSKRKLLRQRCS